MTIRDELHDLANSLQEPAAATLLEHARWLAAQENGTLPAGERFGPVVGEFADRNQAAAALGASEERLRTVLDNAPLILFAVDGHGRSTMRAGSGLTELAARHGFPFTDQAGQSEYEIYDDHPQMRANLRRALAGESFTSLVEIDGHVFECAYGPIRDAEGKLDGAVSVATDVTEREQARQNLRGLRDEHELILQSAGEGIYGQDCQGLTTFVNPAAARMLGWPVEELIGRDMHATLHGTRLDGSAYPPEACPIHAAVADGGVHHATGELFWRQNGTAFPVEYICAPIHDGRNILGAVVTFKDISERRAAEEERARLYQKLLERDKELHEAVGAILLTRSAGHVEIGERDQLARLTPRERDVLERLAKGQTNAEIAGALGVGVGTIKSHVEHLLKKLGLASRTQAAVWADRLGPSAFPSGETVHSPV